MYQELNELSQEFLRIKRSDYKRYFIRTTDFKHKLSIIIGQRGVGKTTTLVQLLLDLVDQKIDDPRIMYVQADHFQVGSATLYEIAEAFYQQGGKWIAFDEIHKYPDWSKELKSIYDTFPKLRVFASGSSALEIYKGSHDLTRRAICYHMHGLSFREYLEMVYDIELSVCSLKEVCSDHVSICDRVIAAVEKKDAKILPAFHRYLRVGYYPYFWELGDESLYAMTLEQNLHTTIDSDLQAIHPQFRGKSAAKLKQLLKFVAHAVPFVPNWKKIQEVIDVVDPRTLRTYFQHLEDADLIHNVPLATQKMKKVERPGKVFLNNTNQLYAMAVQSPDPGTLRETFFLSMLKMHHEVGMPKEGDFLIDQKMLFEVGRKNKSFGQVQNHKGAFLACDDMERGHKNRIPLWVFGLLY